MTEPILIIVAGNVFDGLQVYQAPENVENIEHDVLRAMLGQDEYQIVSAPALIREK